MSIKEDLINTLAENLTYEDIVRAEEYSEGYAEGFKDGLEADRPQEWIPCSEKLPDYMIAVLTWDGMAYAVEKRIPYITDEDGEHIMSEWWVSDDFDEENTEYYPNLRDGAAIAWMPLPEPWEGADDE